MRVPFVVALVLAGAGPGCSLLLDSNASQCSNDRDCAAYQAICDRATWICVPEVVVIVRSERDAGATAVDGR